MIFLTYFAGVIIFDHQRLNICIFVYNNNYSLRICLYRFGGKSEVLFIALSPEALPREAL